jgi:hypothetical protein
MTSVTVTATVVDIDGRFVADGTVVTFAMVALGTVNPTAASTVDGQASTKATPLSVAVGTMTVVVSAGDVGTSATFTCLVFIPD